MKTYVPRTVDVRFMQNLVGSLTIGGVWSYKDQPIMFRKTAEKQMTLFLADGTLSQAEVEEQVRRNKVVMAAAGIEFIDGRKS